MKEQSFKPTDIPELKSNVLAVLCVVKELQGQAQTIARDLGLEVIFMPELEQLKAKPRLKAYAGLYQRVAAAHGREEFALRLGYEGLSLLNLQTGVLVGVDFCSGKTEHRRRFGGGSGQLIAKAVGVKSGWRPRVLDATAGLGGDSFVLATLGCPVLMLERSPVVQQLLSEGLQRAHEYCRTIVEPEDRFELAEVLGHMELLFDDSVSYLAALAQVSDDKRPDVVYLDPMFPERKKAAEVKKEMQAFHSIVGADTDSAQLLDLGLGACQKRVVVKRPKKSDFLDDREPDYQVDGKSSRYDVYLKQEAL